MPTGTQKTIPPDALIAALFLPLLFLVLFYLHLNDYTPAGVLGSFAQFAGL
ncbi:hypothetical protein [Methylocystis echinoides]|jgi:hypothetical protein|uniref:hypothetical protein n=1 Tax=Methylocystis echinoides TaxID=29468 RepID=UPI0034177DAE